MSLPQYFKYKASGVQWPTELPEHWGIRKVKKLASRVSSGKTPTGGSETYVDEGVVFIRSQNVYDEGLRLDDVAYISDSVDEEMAVSRVMPNDILLNITGASIGRSCIVPDGFPRANVNQHVCAIRVLQDVSVNFIAWYFKSIPIKTQIDFLQNGAGREGLNFDQIGRMVVAIPTFSEMASIVIFLNREVAKIDALISEQEKLITLLAEKRQATISHAVTKGLNPNVPMKDSGVEWLGEVPEHWGATRLSHLTRKIVDGAHFTPTYVDDGIPFLRVTDISSPGIDLSQIKRIPLSEHQQLSLRCNPEKGDLLLSKNGTIGVPRVVSWDWEFSIFVSLCLIKFNKKMLPYFAFYVFLSSTIESQINAEIKQSTVINLHLEKIAGFKFPVPPIEEQLAIVEFLNVETTRLDVLISEANRGIALLKERRNALISAAVTGKIDVRRAFQQEPSTIQEAA